MPSPTTQTATAAAPVVSGSAAANTQSGEPAATHRSHSGGGFSLFGGGKRRELESELEGLRTEVARLSGMNPEQIAAERQLHRDEIERLRLEEDRLRANLHQAMGEIATMQEQLVQTQEEMILQDAGIYQYLHPLEDAVAYKARLTKLQDQIKSLVRGGGAVNAAKGWTVNGSAREGAAMVRDFSKLMLRAYNAEADNCVRTVKPHRVQALIDRLNKVRETIARLGKTMDISISAEYHRARVNEIKLTADYQGKVEEEKERVRAQREQQREEERAQREFEKEKARLLKEKSHYVAALMKVRAAGGTPEAIAELQGKLSEIDGAIHGVEEREANIRAGYVYVISNIGAFGPNMVKIGMTRRLEPQDRIRELGDASVPFRFDTHALIFSEDAVGLESKLHAELAERRVNHVNVQREFFYVTSAEVRDVLQKVAGQHLLEYHEAPEAVEWHASQAARQHA